MNLQQLRYVVATADEGTMTQAAASLHVAQPALSRAVAALESEIDVAVFERGGRGVRVSLPPGAGGCRTRPPRARRRRSHRERRPHRRRSASAGDHVPGPRIALAAVARFVAGGGGRVSLDVVDTPDEVVDSVRDGRARLGLMELPAPPGLRVASLGWQEIVLLHPPDWTLQDPFELTHLPEIALLAPEGADWRRDRMVRSLRAAGIEPNITAETNDRDLMRLTGPAGRRGLVLVRPRGRGGGGGRRRPRAPRAAALPRDRCRVHRRRGRAGRRPARRHAGRGQRAADPGR